GGPKLLEMAAGDVAGLEHGAELVRIQHFSGHGIDPRSRSVAILVVAEPDCRQPVRLTRCIAEPNRVPTADGTGGRLPGGEALEHCHATTLRMRYLLSTSIRLPSSRCTRRFAIRHHWPSRSTTISVTRFSSSRRASASATRIGTGLRPPWACHHWPA